VGYIHLYTTFYNEKNEQRRRELIRCLEFNCKNPNIDSITILNEGEPLDSLHNNIIKQIPISKRPSYDDFIQIINDNPSEEDIHIIANTDIYFDKDIGVLKNLNLENTCLALSRWDVLENGITKLYNHNDSQDVWVFKGKVKPELKANFPLGVPRCDNRFMFELEQSGYQVLNPAFSIKAYHLHKGQREKVYTEADNHYKIQPPFRYKYPHNLYGFWKTVRHNVTNIYKLGPYRYDIKKINFWLPIRVIRKSIEIITGKEQSLIGYK